jgi:hypothetical protein
LGTLQQVLQKQHQQQHQQQLQQQQQEQQQQEQQQQEQQKQQHQEQQQKQQQQQQQQQKQQQEQKQQEYLQMQSSQNILEFLQPSNNFESKSSPPPQSSYSSCTTDKYLQTLQKIAKENAETGQFRTSLQPKEMSSTSSTAHAGCSVNTSAALNDSQLEKVNKIERETGERK